MASRRQLAVALRYDAEREAAPRVLAKGSGRLAQRIIDLAGERGIALHRDDDLVQVLASLEVDREIPPRLYLALAEVLAFLYQRQVDYRNLLK